MKDTNMLPLMGEVSASFVSYLEKYDRDISGVRCIAYNLNANIPYDHITGI